MQIIFEDKNILAINKPAGLLVHGDGRKSEKEESTLVDWLLENYPEINGVGESLVLEDGTQINRSGIVHRLDKETSGIILVAKNSEAHTFLKEQFKNREIKKIYHAFAYGNIKDDRGIIDKAIAKSKNDFRQWTTTRNSRGPLREAITHFRVLNRGEDLDSTPGQIQKYVFLELMPKTGRTHQLRVHLKGKGCPIVCDSLYASKMPAILGFNRLALHARKISFKVLEGKEIILEADYPDDFIKALA